MTVDIIAGWLSPEEVIGQLDINRVRGREITSVRLNPEWIENHNNIILDPDLGEFRGTQYPTSGKQLFGFLSDTSPDRWGRKLIDRAEAIRAAEEQRTARTLTESDYLLGISDELRYGGIRFRIHDSGTFLSSSSEKIPPITSLRELEEAAHGYETQKDNARYLKVLIDPGSSLGGARPKVNVIDPEGQLWIAKFPSKNDDYDVGAWEMVEHDLAVKCGINVPDAKLMKLSEYGSTFLSRRFDRQNGKRIHMMSFMTALSKTDGHTDGTGYLDIAEQLELVSVHPEQDLKEMWSRITFSVLTSNCDDHLRNHALILGQDGWHLSPAYDLNPAKNKDSLSLCITEHDSRRIIENVIEISGFFRVSEKEAIEKISWMQETIHSSWMKMADRYHIPEQEMQDMSSVFTECEKSNGISMPNKNVPG